MGNGEGWGPLNQPYRHVLRSMTTFSLFRIHPSFHHFFLHPQPSHHLWFEKDSIVVPGTA